MPKSPRNLAACKQRISEFAQQQRLTEARDLCRQICRTHKADAESWFLLGTIEGLLGNYVAAEEGCRMALRLDSSQPGLHYNLGVVLARQGRLDEAIESFETTLQLDPTNTEARHDLGNVLVVCGRLDEALQHYRVTIQQQPGFIAAHLSLARALRKRNPAEAIEQYRVTISLDPCLLDAYSELATILINNRQYELCKQTLDLGIKKLPKAACLHYKLGISHQQQGEVESALACYERAAKLAPERDDIKAARASTLALLGDSNAAEALLLPLIEAESRDPTVALTFGYLSSGMDREDEAIAFLESGLNSPGIDDSVKSRLCFSLARLLDRRGRYEEAFTYADTANRLHGAALGSSNIADWIYNNREVFSGELQRRTEACDVPVFIVGMPRSGTSLVEQILASHSRVYGAGELKDIAALVAELPILTGNKTPYPACLGGIKRADIDSLASKYLEHISTISRDSMRVTDKTPGNFLYLGLIDMMFPSAHVIHCIRDPMDTCLSCYLRDFSGNHPYSYNLDALGRYYCSYEKLMKFWKETLRLPILDVRYERLVTDTENTVREMTEFIGLSWESGLLNFHQQKRSVATASFDQVRKPIYSHSINHWHHYERHLDALKAALGL
ncbi:sulfotransferase [Gammaproteobacteria bacterium]|nr:sulfotransferase [Gammaproteobacteria bacterium]